MDITITSITEVNDYQLEVLFNYEGHDLKTSPLPKKSTEEEIKEAIKITLDRWLSEIAVENFEQLKELEGTTICI